MCSVSSGECESCVLSAVVSVNRVFYQQWQVSMRLLIRSRSRPACSLRSRIRGRVSSPANPSSGSGPPPSARLSSASQKGELGHVVGGEEGWEFGNVGINLTWDFKREILRDGKC